MASDVRAPLGSQQEFPAAQKSTYLNAASIALMYRRAAEATAAWQQDLAEYGTLKFDETAEATVFDDLYVAFARLIGARTQDIAAGSSATELIASLAWATMPGADQNIVATDVVFPATVYPWTRVARHTGCEMRWVSGQDAYADQRTLIQKIDAKTAVVCVSHVEYGSGQRYDLGRIAEAAHAHGAMLVVDATQSAGAIPINAPLDGIDALITAGYKWLCGPFGAALMYLAPELQTKFEPGLVGFRSNRRIWNLQPDRIEYSNDARRFECSTMAYGCAVGLQVAIEYLLELGIENIFAHNLRLADSLADGLDQMGAQILSPRNGNERSSIISVRFPGLDSKKVVERLKENNVIVSPRRDFIRFSPHLYNGMEDVERALEELGRVLKRERSEA